MHLMLMVMVMVMCVCASAEPDPFGVSSGGLASLAHQPAQLWLWRQLDGTQIVVEDRSNIIGNSWVSCIEVASLASGAPTSQPRSNEIPCLV